MKQQTPTTPNKENIEHWLAALRSGKYTQGRGCLRSIEDKFCCLGVACDVYMTLTGEGKWAPSSYQPDTYVFTVDNEIMGSALPQKVKNFYGVSGSNPLIKGGDNAIWLNDSKRVNFNQMADYIGETYLNPK